MIRAFRGASSYRQSNISRRNFISKRHKGAFTVAEGNYEYKVDVDVIFNNGRERKDFVIRTCYDQFPDWRIKHSISTSPFKAIIDGNEKFAAIIDREVWVFGIDATNPRHIVDAVNIGVDYFKVRPSDVLGDIYVKNLNAECEHQMQRDSLVEANKALYKNTCLAIREAARNLNCSDVLNFWVFSNNKNPKINKDALHGALKEGGACSVETDFIVHRHMVGSNDGLRKMMIKNNLHLAKLDI